VRLIRDGASVVVEGFVGQGFAEGLTLALEERFLQIGTPSDLTLVFTVAERNRQGRRRHRLLPRGSAQAGLWVVIGRWRPSWGKMAVEPRLGFAPCSWRTGGAEMSRRSERAWVAVCAVRRSMVEDRLVPWAV